MFHFFLRHPSVTSIIQACSLVYVIAGKLHSLMGAGWCGRFENFQHSRTESDRVGMRTFAGWNGWQFCLVCCGTLLLTATCDVSHIVANWWMQPHHVLCNLPPTAVYWVVDLLTRRLFHSSPFEAVESTLFYWIRLASSLSPSSSVIRTQLASVWPAQWRIQPARHLTTV